ncbi:endonuclease/exonuclease/phosphatase family metal-dependent hydrolase [Haloferula luteola]|uniref:Endonuclease/exonuclease/phosphatase family metal-dependent hydrolase n=1 Tax=Haloferula luteola TaxID=595692 RepID=A0A840V309_9BACT|nr:endonuclease/exonuclease/phosphatase family protein [Haloferula luteola]MBB5351436.1 endonuclease/exonuclease/phosphatase family metal-dependent hydrolase [Haloferula luteola]
MFRFVVLAWLPAWIASATGLRVATFNIETHRNAEGWPDYALGDPGTLDHDSVAAILERIDADVVALQEVHTSDLSGSPLSEVELLGQELGLPYVHAGSNSGNFDTSLRVVILSRYPLLMADSVTSPGGAKEISRHVPAVVVDVPGTTADPLILSAHLKSGTTTADRFRRAIEMHRLVEYLDASGFTEADNFIVMGDFNPSSSDTTFTSLPSGLPSTYVLGGDVSFPVKYSTQMLSYFQEVSPVQLDPRQLNGDDGTYEYGQTLDLLMVSPAMASRPHGSEVYDSAADVAMGGGLAKPGPLPYAEASADASDHFAVFADFELDSDLGSLGLAASQVVLTEGYEAVQMTVTLPSVQSSAVEVTLTATEEGGVFGASTLTISAGETVGTTSFSVPRDFLVTGDRQVTVNASAGGFDSAQAVLEVHEGDGAYELGRAESSVVESFDGFEGTSAPAPWQQWLEGEEEPIWLGRDAGSLVSAGARSYGIGTDGSLGVLGSRAVWQASVRNTSEEWLSILDLAYDAEQWRSSQGGSADGIEISVVVEGQVIAVPGLTHGARTDLPSGSIDGGWTTHHEARVTGLAIPPGGEFGLRMAFFVDASAAPPSTDVWINELHYDNEGSDSGEFIEVVVGPGFTGSREDLAVFRYNGSVAAAATVYGEALSLASDFTEGSVEGGYQILVADLPADGLQNGGNDGLAVVDQRTGEVLHLISYEGVMTASDGPAASMSSVDIGVAESGSTPLGASLGLVGSGAASADFAWANFSASSRGELNPGQILDSAAMGFQGLAVDDVVMTFVGDLDRDGMADGEDEDDDNDGLSDGDELAFGSDPRDRNSVFRVEVDASGVRFPGAEGIDYTVEWCDDLWSWDHQEQVEGAGGMVTFSLPEGESHIFVRIRAGEP